MGTLVIMSDVTRMLSDIEQGNPNASEQLLTQVYEELRRLAAQKLAQEKPGQTLQATALVHEAYLKLVGGGTEASWDSRGHFFAAAAEAMRRILIDNARRKGRNKHGGDCKRVDLNDVNLATLVAPDELLLIDEAIDKLAMEDPKGAQLVRMRYYAGLSVDDAAELSGLSRSTAFEHWSYAKAWLHTELYER